MILANLNDGSSLVIAGVYHDILQEHMEIKIMTLPTVGTVVQSGITFYKSIGVHFAKVNTPVYEAVKDMKLSELAAAIIAQYQIWASELTNPPETPKTSTPQLWPLFEYVNSIGIS